MTKMTLPMAEMPGVIHETIRVQLTALGLTLSDPSGRVTIDDERLERVLRDIANNATQALFSIDESAATTLYEIGYSVSFELRKAYQANGVDDATALAGILLLEQGKGTATDVTNLCHLAELAGVQWRELFPDVIPARARQCATCERPAIEDATTCGSIACREHDDSPAPSTADLLAVGETLRALAAQGRPNAHTAPALARVGQWLADTARAELAKGKAA